MSFLRGLGKEILSLFVDDWLFTALCLAWLGAVWVASRRIPPSEGAPILFTGIAGLILWQSTRSKRKQ